MESTGIGTGIRMQRERLGMSQQDLAQACMVSRQTISNWETGKTLPDIQSMAYLAEVFGVTVDDLVNQVAPELGKRVSVDKRELLLLTLGIIFIGVLYIPLEMVLERSDVPAPDIPACRNRRDHSSHGDDLSQAQFEYRPGDRRLSGGQHPFGASKEGLPPSASLRAVYTPERRRVPRPHGFRRGALEGCVLDLGRRRDCTPGGIPAHFPLNGAGRGAR